MVSWDPSKPMVADESENVEFFVKGVPDSGDSAGAFFSHSLGGKVEARRLDGGSLSIYTYAAENLTRLGANLIDASGFADAMGNSILVTHASASSAFALATSLEGTPYLSLEDAAVYDERRRDSCTTAVRSDEWDNSISSMVGGIGLSFAWSSSVASDELELLECQLGQLLSLFTDRSAKERLTSSIVVQPRRFFFSADRLFGPHPDFGTSPRSSTIGDLSGVVLRPGAFSA